MNAYSQITFDFTENPEPDTTSPSIGIRLKSLKSNAGNSTLKVPENVELISEEETAPPDTELNDLMAEPMDEEENESMTDEPIVIKSTRGRKSLKTLAADADLISIPPDEILFQKRYYSIGEVSTMFRVNASLLRFWESEFEIIQPKKNKKGDRHFRPVDIKNLQLIYDLLRRRKLTIEGAREFQKKNKKSQERFEAIQSLQKIKSYLLELKAAL